MRPAAVASGKGGVGKSSVTVNLAAALAAAGQKVGVLDADIYGHSIPRMLGVTGQPTQVEQMMMPPSAHGVKVISIGMFTTGNTPVVWRGPMLHRAVQQFLADVYWGDLDVLLMDLPPGTGDVAISVAQLVPTAELLVVTTPQLAASEVAERAGALAVQTHQRIAGVIENMSGLPCPHCGEMLDVFGTGGGQAVAAALTRITGVPVPILGQVPIDPRLRQGGDEGLPLVLSNPDAPAAQRDRGRRTGAGQQVTRAGRAASGPDPGVVLPASGGLGVVGRGLARRERRAGVGRRGRLVRLAEDGIRLELVKQVLADERARVEVGEVELRELGPQALGQVALGTFGQPAQLPKGAARLGGDLGQLIRPEDHDGEHQQHRDLGEGQVKHWASPGERPARVRAFPSL